MAKELPRNNKKSIDKISVAWYNKDTKREREVIAMTREQMIDNVIRMYGFECKWTVWFCELAETLTESQLLNAYILLESGVVANEEEEE